MLPKSYFLGAFQAETLFVYPKPYFGHTYKVSAWNSHQKCDYWHCIFRKTLVKQPPAARNDVNEGTTHAQTWFAIAGFSTGHVPESWPWKRNRAMCTDRYNQYWSAHLLQISIISILTVVQQKKVFTSTVNRSDKLRFGRQQEIGHVQHRAYSENWVSSGVSYRRGIQDTATHILAEQAR